MNEKIAFDIGDTFLGSGHFLTQLTGVSTLVSLLVSNILYLLGTVLIFIIVYAGMSMISASGDVQQFARARNILTAGVTGFIIVVAAWFIVKIIEGSTGVTIL